jgi:hypothetical protein
MKEKKSPYKLLKHLLLPLKRVNFLFFLWSLYSSLIETFGF